MSLDLSQFSTVLNAQLVAAAITPEIAWPNVVYQPQKGIPYLGVSHAGRARSPLGFGIDAVQQWQGSYQVTVFVPRDSGEALQAQLAGRVLAAFPRGLVLMTNQSVRVIISVSSAAVPVPYGDWSGLPCTMSWFATETVTP